jgi:urease alpha subunit
MKRNRAEFAKLRLSLVARLDKPLAAADELLHSLGAAGFSVLGSDGQLTYRSQELLVRALITSETAGDRAPRIGSAAPETRDHKG